MKKITTVCLFALVCSMMVGSISNVAYADSQTESLVKIATQAREQLRIQLSKIGDVSEELQVKFDEGSSETKLLEEAARGDDVSEARKHFLFAMKIFNEISKEISEYNASEAAITTSQTSTLSNNLDRLERYVERLKQIAIKNEVIIDSTNVDRLIEIARKYLSENNYEKASSETENAKKAIIGLNKELQEKTRQYRTDRAKSFAQKHLEQLDSLINQAQKIGVSQKTINRLLEAKANLYSATDVDQIIREVKHLMLVKEEFENTKEQRIKSRMNQLESKFNRLSSYADENTDDFEKAKTMFKELKELIKERKLGEAVSLINSLNNFLTEIENSISSEYNETDSKDDHDKISSLSESKKERIKIKIQRLETEMNEIAGHIEENPAAKRWLDSAFSLLDEAKNFVDDSPDRALKIIMKIKEILTRVQNINQ